MIVVNGMEYRTLDDELTVNGKKVREAYANGAQVYPDNRDIHHSYVVATGEADVDLSSLYTGDAAIIERSVHTNVKAKVTWVVRFNGEVTSVSDSGTQCMAVISSPDFIETYGYLKLEAWTIVELDIADSGGEEVYTHTEYTSGRIYDTYKWTNLGAVGAASGTYAFKRPVNSYNSFTAQNFGDIGVAGEWGIPSDSDYYPLEDIPVVRISLGEQYVNERQDIDIYSGTSSSSLRMYFGDIEFQISNLLEIVLTEVLVNYRDQNYQYIGWVDTTTDFETRIDYYGDTVYTNDGTWVWVSSFNRRYAKPHKEYMYRRFKVRASKIEAFAPGESLPSTLIGIDDIGPYEGRTMTLVHR